MNLFSIIARILFGIILLGLHAHGRSLDGSEHQTLSKQMEKRSILLTTTTTRPGLPNGINDQNVHRRGIFRGGQNG